MGRELAPRSQYHLLCQGCLQLAQLAQPVSPIGQIEQIGQIEIKEREQEWGEAGVGEDV